MPNLLESRPAALPCAMRHFSDISDHGGGLGETIVLPPHCGTAAAEDLLARLVIASDREQDITVDASAVESIGQAIMQLLLAARIDAEHMDQMVTIMDPSPAFMERVDLCRLSDALGVAAFLPSMTNLPSTNSEGVRS